MLSLVLIISYVFHCFFNLCILLFLLFEKWAIFGLKCKDKRLRDLENVCPIFKFFFKMRKARKKKVSEWRGAIHMRSRSIKQIVEGGGGPY